MIRALFCILFLASTASAGLIQVPLVDVDPQQLDSRTSITGKLPSADDSRGWAFTLRFPTTVTHLAWNDTNRDGLSHSHAVGIWRNILDGFTPGFSQYFPEVSVDQLVFETVIPAGTQAELSGPWRRVPVGPILLPPGEYHIVGQNHSDSTDDLVYWSSRGPFSGDARLIVEGARLAGMSLGRPDFGPVQLGNWLEWGDFPIPAALMGPMLFVEVIPEPSTWVMALAACVWYRQFAVRRQR
jgi:hypothetical protein